MGEDSVLLEAVVLPSESASVASSTMSEFEPSAASADRTLLEDEPVGSH